MKLSKNCPPNTDSAKVMPGLRSRPRSYPKHLAAVGSAMLLVIAVQTWLVVRTPVTSIDAVRFVSIAQSIEADGLLHVLHTDREQPLFPMIVCGTHRILDTLGVDPAVIWMRSVQVAAVLGLLLAIPAIYLVAVQVVGHAAAWAGVMVLTLLPEVARLGADGLADPWQWALVAWAVVLLAKWVRKKTEDRGQKTEKQRRTLLVGAGELVALALLVRIETTIVIGAVVLYIVGGGLTQVRSCVSNSAWDEQKRTMRNGACFLLGLGAVLVPYLLLCGTYQPSQAIARLLGRTAAQETDRPIVNEIHETPRQAVPASIAATSSPDIPGLATFSTKEPGKSIRHRGLTAAVVKVAEEVADLFGYGVGLLALVGVWILRRRPQVTLDRFSWIFVGLFLAVIAWFTTQEGYVTARHLLLLLIPGTGCIGVGLLAVGDWFGDRIGNRSKRKRFFTLASRPLVTVVVLVVLAVGLITPHRMNRSPYREAGRWLAQQTHARATPGAVFDTRGWTSLFSTRPTYQAERAKDAFADPRLEYVVVMEEELQSDSPRSRTLQRLLDRDARRVARFTPSDARRSSDALVVYRYVKHDTSLAHNKTNLYR